MAISRFDKFLTSDYGMNWYQPQLFTPNFEMLGKQIESAELEKNQFDTMANAQVDYLQGIHDEPAKAVKEKIQQTKDMLSEAVASGDMSKYKSAQRQGLGELKSLYLPGGDAYKLAEAKKTYNAQLAEIDKNVKGDPNRAFAKATLKQSTIDYWNIQKSIQAGSPTIIDYQDMEKDLIDAIGKLQASDMDEKNWIKSASQLGLSNIPKEVLFDIKKKGLSSERIGDLTKALFSGDKYRNQLMVNIYSTTGILPSTPQEVKQEKLLQVQTSLQANKQKALENIDNQGKELLAQKKNPKVVSQFIQERKQDIENEFKSLYPQDTDELMQFYKTTKINDLLKVAAPFTYVNTDRKAMWNVWDAKQARIAAREKAALAAVPETPITTNVELTDLFSSTLDNKNKSNELSAAARGTTNMVATSIGVDKGDSQARANVLFSLDGVAKSFTKSGVLDNQAFINYVQQHKDSLALNQYNFDQVGKIAENFVRDRNRVSAALINDVKAYEEKLNANAAYASLLESGKTSPEVNKVYSNILSIYSNELSAINVKTVDELIEAEKNGKLDNIFKTDIKTNKPIFTRITKDYSESGVVSQGTPSISYLMKEALLEAEKQNPKDFNKNLGFVKIFSGTKDLEEYSEAKAKVLTTINSKLQGIYGLNGQPAVFKDKAGNTYDPNNYDIEYQGVYVGTNNTTIYTAKLKQGKETIPVYSISRSTNEDRQRLNAAALKVVSAGVSNGDAQTVVNGLTIQASQSPGLTDKLINLDYAKITDSFPTVSFNDPQLKESFSTHSFIDLTTKTTVYRNNQPINFYIAKQSNNTYRIVNFDENQVQKDDIGRPISFPTVNIVPVDFSSKDPFSNKASSTFSSPQEAQLGLLHIQNVFNQSYQNLPK